MSDVLPDPLSPQDAAAVDQLADSHFAATSDPKTEAWRGLFAQVGRHFGEVPAVSETLAAKTLIAVGNASQIKRKPAPVSSAARSIWWRRYVREIGASAVAATIFGAVVLLGVHQARQSGNRVACAENLGVVANAFSTYASANNSALPALANSGDHNWLSPNLAIPGSHSNTDNLLPLLNASLIKPANLICPGRGTGEAGYSYLNLFGPTAYNWSGSHSEIVLSDRNPLFGQRIVTDPNSNSLNHAGNGSYVLHGDAAVTWETSPNIGPAHDNIWTLSSGGQVQLTYAGTEVSRTPTDVFLSP